MSDADSGAGARTEPLADESGHRSAPMAAADVANGEAGVLDADPIAGPVADRTADRSAGPATPANLATGGDRANP